MISCGLCEYLEFKGLVHTEAVEHQWNVELSQGCSSAYRSTIIVDQAITSSIGFPLEIISGRS